jgi:preprotein translocase subunit SecA
MIDKVLTLFLGSKHERDLKGLLPQVQKINELEPRMMGLPDEEFPRKTEELRSRHRQGESLDALLPEAFALAREAARRALGERIFDVQLMGGIVLHQGKIMEMKTGEGKTLSSVTAAYLNALPGEGVHVVTVNDYLAERDAGWMGQIYRFLGVSVGVILSQMDNEARRQAYRQDFTYGTNNEFGFDYLRDNMRWDSRDKVQRGHNYCIVDEIDSILIDEARTPLIISGSAEDDTYKIYEVNRLADSLAECDKDPQTGEYPEFPKGDYKIEEKNKRVSFTDQGMNHVEELLTRRGLIRSSVFESDNFEYIHYFTQALRAKKLFHRDVDYVVQDGKVQIVDEFTGRILYGRRYSEGLHQAIEGKERIRIEARNRTLATITFQNYFRMYRKLAGMTGTADTEAAEFTKIYNLDVVVIPTNRPMVREDRDDVIFLNEEDKFRTICGEIAELHQKGQPVLVGTVSIEKSEKLSRLLTGQGIRHEVLNAKNHAREALIIAEAGARGAVTIATNMAGRGTDIKLGGNPEYRARRRAGTQATSEEQARFVQEEQARWQKDYEEVKTQGGLHVLGTERHESRRIDNQLRGRSGRQGDPGSSRFYISLDDELMRLFGGENLKSLMGRVGLREGEPIFHPWINKSIERAQKRVEERNFEIRKHLLEYDDVLNEQRKFIYSRRDEILADGRLRDRVLDTAREIVSELVEVYHAQKQANPMAMTGLLAALKERLFYSPGRHPEDLSMLGPRELEQLIMQELEEDIRAKEEEIGADNFNLFIRMEYLRNIDIRWQDHLESLEALREAVYLRAYSQKNPLLEYKLEGFQIFDSMLMEIRSNIAKKIFMVRIQPFSPDRRPARQEAVGVSRHQQLGQFGGRDGAGGGGGAARGGAGGAGSAGGADRSAVRVARQDQPERVQVRRSQPKVGRNDPCPCGSGKKYKYCHGMNG